MTNEDAIKILEEMPISSNVHFEEIAEAIGIAIKALRNERPRGEWLKTNDYVTCAYGCIDYVKCSCCKNDSLEEGDYCPNCGADMRGGQDDDPN